MLRTLIRLVFGQKDHDSKPSASPLQPRAVSAPPPSAPSPRWRGAPTRTLTDDLGNGVTLTTTYATGHHGFVSLVGESHYQDALRALAVRIGSHGIFTACLVPEPSNPYDANAVVVCAADVGKIGYLARNVARSYHSALARRAEPVTCPARLTGMEKANLGVVLDFEEVREALGLSRVAIDQGDIDSDGSNEYHRVNRATRLLVSETRPLEQSNPTEAVARYRQALINLLQCRDLARAKGIEVYGYVMNQTDATPIDRLTRCLVQAGRVEEAAKELDKFIEEFPHARDMRLLQVARKRVDLARSRT